LLTRYSSLSIHCISFSFRRQRLHGWCSGFNFLGDAPRDQLDPRTRLEMGL